MPGLDEHPAIGNGSVRTGADASASVPAGPAARRTSFRRPADRIAVAVIVVVAALGVVLVGTNSDIGATISETGPDQLPPLPMPTALPAAPREAWRAASSATPVPVAAGSTVVTGDGGEVLGRDPLTGQVRWRYARDLPLCTVSSAWSQAIAVYQQTETLLPEDDPNRADVCSEVTSLQANSGERARQRNGDAQVGTQLVSDGVHVTATGRRLLNTWRSDLVLTMEYGTVPTLVQPDKQPRTDCTFGSVAVTTGRIGVLERCPIDPGDRLTVYEPTNDDSDEPSVDFSSVVGGRSARVVALGDELAAAVREGPTRLVVFNNDGNQVAEYQLDLPATDLAGDPPGLVVPTSKGDGLIYWFTGSRTIALSSTDLRPLWTVEDTLGPGTVFAGHLLVPVADGLAALDPATGARVAGIPVNRDGYLGPVLMSTIGPVLLEQRGPTLVALR